MRVEEDEEIGGKRKNKSQAKEVVDDLGLSMLIDSQNNQYVLTKPRDSTIPRADRHFIKVSLLLLLTSDLILFGLHSKLKLMWWVCLCFLNMHSQDLVSVVMLSLPCGWICTLVGLPPMFGYIICGVLLGPSGLNSIKVTSSAHA